MEPGLRGRRRRRAPLHAPGAAGDAAEAVAVWLRLRVRAPHVLRVLRVSQENRRFFVVSESLQVTLFLFDFRFVENEID